MILAHTKAMAKRSGASLNGIVIAIDAGALERYRADPIVEEARTLGASIAALEPVAPEARPAIAARR